MAKKSLQDMIPSEKRSIRRVDIPRSGKRSKPRIQQEDNSIPPRRSKNSGRAGRSWLFWLIVIVLILGAAALFVASFFSGATVRVVPRQEVVTIDGIFSARQGAEYGELSYEVMKVEEEAVREVPASGEEHVERKASGTITVYNTFDENSQRLIKNTRFESPEGLIFRIQESVVVPGMDGDEPGTIEVTAYADTSGVEYNIGPSRFTVPGLESDPARFEAFYAESTAGMRGGFSGVSKVVSEDDRTLAEDALEDELSKTLLDSARSQIPEGFILFDDATLITFDPVFAEAGAAADTARLTMKGVLYGIIFDEERFGEYLALQTVSDYDRAPVVVHDLSTVDLSLSNQETLIPTALERLDIAIQGTPRLVWQFDGETLREDLAGVEKKDTETERVFSGYPAIQEADVVVRPFWKRSLPSDTEEIDIEVLIEK